MYGLNDVIQDYAIECEQLKKILRKISSKSKAEVGDTISTLKLKLDYIDEVVNEALEKYDK